MLSIGLNSLLISSFPLERKGHVGRGTTGIMLGVGGGGHVALAIGLCQEALGRSWLHKPRRALVGSHCIGSYLWAWARTCCLGSVACRPGSGRREAGNNGGWLRQTRLHFSYFSPKSKENCFEKLEE
ncbi:unnamed protein product [Cuscuta campestris]|uniref:Uncharacterized protein n=1 Tax=Cuscuta campestris TaxID=132261 RepID=A0A484N0W0_9ASTE|nr:unnamed protein product [Cuscuta campestris]